MLKQIDLPHPYYFREMYLPQLTSGPSSVAWFPDSSELVYSMQGTLWRQKLGTNRCEQLTDGSGYDYQPDVSPDGRSIVFVRYWNDALELYSLDVATRAVHPLTSGGKVNVEPRWSPDGKRLVFVSTLFHNRFHIFVAKWQSGSLREVERLTGETRSSLPRYYYSQFDHEISPTWSADGSEIAYISNRGHIHGTGGLWRMKAEPGSTAREIRYEETNWRMRPDWSHDGRRLVYSSYLGRNWHQLWIMPIEISSIQKAAEPASPPDPFPLTYGEYDITNARWSWDGKYLAYISNQQGNTSLWIQDVMGGRRTQVETAQRTYLKPKGTLLITVLDDSSEAASPVPARVSVTAADGRAYAPDDAWVHADDGFDRAERSFEAHYFHSPGESKLVVPEGLVNIEVQKGFDYGIERRTVEVPAGQSTRVAVKLVHLEVPAPRHTEWVTSDLHVHMNYGGTYRSTPEILASQAEAENLQIVNNLIVNKEQRIPDIGYFSGQPDRASTRNALVLHSQEFHTSYWGHLGLLGLKSHVLIPGYAGYTNTAAASLMPMNAMVADSAHQQGGLAGYVHPFDAVPDPATETDLHNELPVDVALGKIDYYEVMGFSDHKASAEVWYKLLNLGFRLPAGAGTDAMTNFASLRGPVGMNRVYVNVAAPQGSGTVAGIPHPDLRSLPPDVFLAALKQGRTFVTNGPLIGFTLDGRHPGEELASIDPYTQSVPFTVWLRSPVDIDHAEIVCNGEVRKAFGQPEKNKIMQASGSIELTADRWCVFRAYGDTARYPILDIYPYSTTSPVYIGPAYVGSAYIGSTQSGPKSRALQQKAVRDTDYFLAWIDRLVENVKVYPDWNTEEERAQVLETLREARRVFEKKRSLHSE